MSSRVIVILGIVGSILFIGAGSAPIFFISYDASGVQNIGNWGQFISGLFAPVAFVWVVIAVVLQGRELELQREELRDTREVLNLQKEEMKRAAEEAREQTRIMTENLRAEGERQVYSEVEIILYSLALFIVSNYSRSQISFNNGSISLIDATKLYENINRDNSDRVFTRVFSSLTSADNAIRQRHGENFQFVSGGREFFMYIYETFTELTKQSKYTENKLAAAKLKGLQIGESLMLMESIKRAVIGGI